MMPHMPCCAPQGQRFRQRITLHSICYHPATRGPVCLKNLLLWLYFLLPKGEMPRVIVSSAV